MPDPDARLQAAARLDGAAWRLADALDHVTIGPSEWCGDAAERFHADLAEQRRRLADVAAALRRRATQARIAAAPPTTPA